MRHLIGWLTYLIMAGGVIQAQVTGLSDWTIFLVPGHSRTENKGAFGYSEAERNLRVALRLRDLLLNNTDIDTVYLSRTNDYQEVSLSQRTDRANSLGADWYHSIHSDASSNPNYNSTLLLWGQYYDGREKVPHGGWAMSEIMVDLLTRGMRTDTRGAIGDCSFYTWSNFCRTSGGPYLHVNRTTIMPSELSEAGFHTNPRQNQLFMNADWKKLEATTFYWSILEFHGLPRPFVGICTGIISDLESGVPINGATVRLNGRTYVTDTYKSLFHKYSNDPDRLHNGFYYFDQLPDDTLQMIVTHPDYYPDTLQIAVQKDFFTFEDVTLLSKIPPRIVSTTPREGDQAFPAWNDIVITFSRPMNHASVETTFVILPEASGGFMWIGGNRMIFRPDSLQYETDYTVTISGKARDAFGHFFDGNGDGEGGDDFTLHFRTSRADLFPPRIVGYIPGISEKGVDLFPVVNLTFDEVIDSASITSTSVQVLRYSGQKAVPGELRHYVVRNRSVITFFPTNPLEPKQTYLVRINPGIRDRLGNELTSARSYRFSTGETWNDVRTIEDFEAGVSNWFTPQQSDSTTGTLRDSTSRTENTRVLNLLSGSTRSMQLKYGWDEAADAWFIREYLSSGPAREITFDNHYLLQVYLFGDGSGIKFRFAVDDRYPEIREENHEVSPWVTVDWFGWKLVEWDLAHDSTGVWDHLGNRVLEGTLRFDSIQLTHTPGEPTSGTLYFDDLRLANRVLVPVVEPSSTPPEDFVLYQNYPNPFNPTTTIPFALPMRSRVQLKLFDLKGNEVTTLLEENLEPGFHSFVFTARGLASGMYLYRLQTERFQACRKLILLR